MAQVILESVEARTMPPWPPADQCREMKHERRLSPDQIQLVRDWVDAGAPQGDPANEPMIPEDPALDLGEPDLVADIGVDYKPDPPETEFDDYHCFVIDPQLEQEELLNALETVPGNASIVHHVLMYAVSGDQRDQLQAMADAEPDSPGYTCFGGPRASEPVLLGGWVPGAVPPKLPPGHGIPIGADDLLVVQVHYNTINDTQGTDRTEVKLHFTETQQTRMAMLPIADGNLSIAPGAASVIEGTEIELPDNPLVGALKIYGVVPHMHELGKSIDVKIRHKDGSETCAVDVPEWDFDWQGFYLFEDPIQLQPGDVIDLTCEFDNSMARNMSLGRQPQMVTWGEGTRDEMCLNYVIVNNPGIF